MKAMGEYRILLPTDSAAFNDTLRILIAKVTTDGGYTSTTVFGGYRMNNGTMCEESSIDFASYAYTEGQCAKLDYVFKRIVLRQLTIGKQEAVFATLKGEVHLFTMKDIGELTT